MRDNQQGQGLDMCRIREFILMAYLVLPANSATANVLSLADYDKFHQLNLRMRPIGDDIAALIINPPGGPLGREGTLHTQDCIIRLAGNFDAVRARLGSVATVVGIATQMVHDADELLVLKVLHLEARYFQDQMKISRQMLNSTLGRCSHDGATVAKTQEILRVYSDAASLVESTARKIDADLRK
jgi:hypothetical protein